MENQLRESRGEKLKPFAIQRMDETRDQPTQLKRRYNDILKYVDRIAEGTGIPKQHVIECANGNRPLPREQTQKILDAIEKIMAETPYDPLNPLATSLYPYSQSGSAPPPPPGIKPPKKKKVFIVHGHNEAIKYGLAHALQNAGVAVTILDDQTNEGRTLLEKFADHAEEAGFAVVLLTADDVGKAKDATVENRRARQNVVFELGFFFGLLGRGRVCAVYETSVELPSDLQGLAYVPYDQGGGWKLKVAKEIDAAGIEVDFRKL